LALQLVDVGLGDAQPQQESGERVAALEALLAPVGERRQHQAVGAQRKRFDERRVGGEGRGRRRHRCECRHNTARREYRDQGARQAAPRHRKLLIAISPTIFTLRIP
jgi:hypothetical protein